MGKVRYGIKNAKYYPITVGQSGETYGSGVSLPGAVSLTLDRSGDENPFFADDTTYADFSKNNGYEGELELAYMDAAACQALLGFYNNTTDGVCVEYDNPAEFYFGLAFEVESNSDGTIGFKFYRCKMTRPNLGFNTTNESVAPETSSFPIKVIPTEDTNGHRIIKSFQNIANATARTSFYGTMAIPTVPTTA